MITQQVVETKAELQQAWLTQWQKHNKKGTLAGATGMGKTKPAIDVMMEMWRGWKACLSPEDIVDGPSIPVPTIFLAVPTEKLRDEGWPEEVQQWYGEEGKEMWDRCVQAECYANMHTIKNQSYNLVVLDEVHNITALSGMFFHHNNYHSVMGMTATPPDLKRDPEKYHIIKKECPVIFSYTLDQGVDDGVVADFQINVIMSPLDDKTTNIPAGTKAKPFKTTEFRHYDYLSKNLKKLFMLQNMPGQDKAMIEKRIMFSTLNRTRFVYNLPSKTALAAKILETVRPDKRTIVFCGSIKQAEELCGDQVYHSKCKNTGVFERFKAGEGDVCGVVKAANEGHNILNLDQALIVQVDSNERNLVQRIGRTVRVREGHKSVVWIICAQGTVDEKWVEKALTNFDQSKVCYFSSKEFD